MSVEKIKREHQPLHQPKREKQVKVKVHKKRWISKGEKILYCTGTAITLAVSVFFIHFAVQTDELNRDIRSLENQISEQEAYNENLTYQVKELSNPDRILQIAKKNGLNIQNAQVKQAGTVGN